MIRILLDQGLPRSTAEKLREKGWDVVHALDCGLSTAADAWILEFAKDASRTICTLDGDFHALLAERAIRLRRLPIGSGTSSSPQRDAK